MDQLLDAVNDLISEHWVKFLVAAGLTASGWLLGWRRSRQQWRRREFFHRINFSLTSIVDGTLRIRTLAEKSCDDVFLNEAAVTQITTAAIQTKPGLPLIPLPDEDYWFFLNAVLNEVSEQFAAGLIAKDAGLPVKSTNYIIALTNEADGDVRTRKIRALLLNKSLLDGLEKSAPQFESPHHRIRWETVLQIAEQFQKTPQRFLDVEIVTPM